MPTHKPSQAHKLEILNQNPSSKLLPPPYKQHNAPQTLETPTYKLQHLTNHTVTSIIHPSAKLTIESPKHKPEIYTSQQFTTLSKTLTTINPQCRSHQIPTYIPSPQHRNTENNKPKTTKIVY